MSLLSGFLNKLEPVFQFFGQKSELNKQEEQELQVYVSNSGACTLSTFSDEVLVHIFRQCVDKAQSITKVFQTISRISQVCKRFKQICADRFTWHEILREFFQNEKIMVSLPSAFVPAFKALFRKYKTGKKHQQQFAKLQERGFAPCHASDDFFKCLNALKTIDPDMQGKAPKLAWAEKLKEVISLPTGAENTYDKIDAFWKGYIEVQEKAFASAFIAPADGMPK